ncbi:11629_t:CDS:2 [Entrophospora sp. SA101]|nr:11629_t:CDS:2 [Entrophospora sp. SA101]
MSSSSYINNTRRRSTPSFFIDSISEEDIKLLLSSKTPNIISKRPNAKLTTTALLLPMEINDSFQDFTKFNDFYFQTSSTSPSLSSQPKHSLSIKESNYHKNNNSSSSISSTSSSISSTSSSTSSLSSLSSSINISSNLHYNTHSEYKHRTKLTSQKLLNFFGAKPPIDICVREIEKEGLKAILNSKIPLFYFLYSLLEEYSSENLFFFLKVEQYESKQYDNSTQQLVMAQQIFDTYLTRNSQFEVNIDDRVRKLTIAAIKSERDLRYCFRDAKQAVFVLLENSFSRFIRSNLADTMRKEIGEHTAHYSNEARELSVGWLFKYLEKLGPIDVNEIGIKNFSNIIIDNSNNQGFNQVFDYEGWEIDNSNSNSNHYRCNYSGSERNNSNSNIYGGANGKKQELKYKKTKDLKDHLIRNFSSKNQI